MSIFENKQVIEILGKAVEELQALGLDCLISPLSLPHGASITLHVGDTIDSVMAADVATEKGAELAHAASTAATFNNWVVEALSEAVITKAATNAAPAQK